MKRKQTHEQDLLSARKSAQFAFQRQVFAGTSLEFDTNLFQSVFTEIIKQGFTTQTACGDQGVSGGADQPLPAVFAK